MESYSVQAVLSALDKGFTSGMRDAGKATDSLEKKVASASSSLGKGLAAAGAAITAMGVKAVKGFGDFQASLNQAAVIAGGTSKDIERLSAVANKMGADLPLSAQDAADAMTEMARNGASLDTIIELFPAIAEASTAAGSDLIETAGTVQQVMNIWGKSVGSAEQAAAGLTQTANLSNASIESMGVALATVGPNAARSGYSLNDMSTAIGLLTNKGLSSARAAQDLNHAILALQAPSAIAADEMDRLGISAVDANGNLKPFPQTLQEISQALDGMTSAEKTAALKKMVGTAGLQAMGPLLDAIDDKSGNATTSWSAFMKELEKGTSTQEAAKKLLNEQAQDMQNNLGSKIEQVGGNWEALSNTAMAANSAITGSLLDLVSGTLEWATVSKSAGAEAARSFVGLAPYIGTATSAVGGFLMNIERINGTVAKLGNIPGLGTLSDSFNLAKSASNGLKNSATETIQSMKGFAQSHVTLQNFAKGFETARGKIGGLKLGMTDLSTVFGDVDKGIGKTAGAIYNLQDRFPKLTSTAGTAMSGLTKGISGAAKTGTSMISGFLGSVTSIVGIALKAIAPAAIIGLVLAGLGVALSKFGPEMDKFLTMAETKGPQVIEKFVQGITSKLPDLIASGTQMITGLSQTIATLLPVLLQAGVSLVTSLVSGIGQNATALISSALTIVETLVTSLISAAPQLLMAGMNLILNLVQGVVANIPQIVSAVTNILRTFVSAVTSYLPQILQTGFLILQSLVSGILQLLPQLIPVAVQMITTLITGLVSMLPQILQMAMTLVQSLLQGIVQNLPAILAGAIQIIQTLISGLLEALPQIISTGIQIIAQLAASLIQMLPTIIEAGIQIIVALAKGILQAIPSVLQGAWDGIKKGFSTLWDSITGKSSETSTKVSSDTKSMTTSMQSDVSTSSDAIVAKFDATKTSVTGSTGATSQKVKSDFSDMSSTSSAYATDLEGNVTSATSSTKNMSSADIQNLNSNVAASFKKMETSGTTSMQNLQRNMATSSTKAVNATKTSYSQMSETVKTHMNRIQNSSKNAFGKLAANVVASMLRVNAALSSGLNTSVSIAQMKGAQIVNVFQNMSGAMNGAGRMAMAGLASGISAGAGGAIAAANAVANQVSATINRALKIHSPSRVTQKSGEYATEGLEVGLLNRSSYLVKAAQSVSALLSDNLLQASAFDFSLNSGINRIRRPNLNQGQEDANQETGKQPMIINVHLGEHDYQVFIEDVSHSLGGTAELREVF